MICEAMTRELTAAQVTRVEVKELSRSEGAGWYRVYCYLTRPPGKRVLLAWNITSEPAARWLARRIAAHLGIESSEVED
jgi:hypothetical protein